MSTSVDFAPPPEDDGSSCAASRPSRVGRGVRRYFSCARPQSRYFQVSAPSKRRMRTDPSALGSKFLAFTASRLFGFGCSGSQCVTHPPLRHRIVLSVLSPQPYSAVFPCCPLTPLVPA